MPTLNSLDNIAGGAAALGGWQMLVIAGKTITFDRAGRISLTVVASAGSGAKGSSGAGAATGANSGPWGRLVRSVAASDVLVLSPGAGGTAQASSNANGNNGSTSTATLNGTTIVTAQGGEGGRYHASAAVAATPVATITGCDFWVPGLAAGNATGAGGVGSGGAAVDALRSGLGRSPASTTATKDGGTVGTDLGGANGLPWIVLPDFGLSFGDGVTARMPGVGSINAGVDAGWLAGGAANGGRGGPGGGGGGGPSFSGQGGNAYFYLVFVPEE